MFDGFGGCDEFLGPGEGFVLLDETSDECVKGHCCGGVEVAAVCGPPKCGAKVRKLAGVPIVGRALPRTVPPSADIGFQTGEELRVRIAGSRREPVSDELIFCELQKGPQHPESG